MSRTHAIFHIIAGADASVAIDAGTYRPPSLAREGFIHCSYRAQVCEVANRLFRGRTALVLLEIDTRRLPCQVIDENLEGGAEQYPHVYGPVPASAMVHVHAFPCDGDGRFHFDKPASPVT